MCIRDRRSFFVVAIANAIQRFNCREIIVHGPHFLAQALDVAVDGAVIDIDLLVIGHIHQLIAAFHEHGTLGKGLQQHEFGHGQ